MMIGKRPLVPDGISEQFVTVFGRHRMRYLTGGAGPPLLLLHGLMGYSFSWSENLKELRQHATVFAPDLLNTGYSERADVDATLQGVAKQVLAFMDAAGISSADVLGSSHGGSAAMLLAAIAPQRVARLILVSPSNPWSETWRWQVALFANPLGRVLAPAIRFMPAAVNGFFVKRVYHDASRMLPGTVEEYDKPLKIPGTAEYLCKAVKRWYRDFAELERMIAAINCRTLLLWGRGDRVVPLATGQTLLKNLRNAELVTLDAGHLPYEEQPEEFNRTVIDFLLRRGT